MDLEIYLNYFLTFCLIIGSLKACEIIFKLLKPMFRLPKNIYKRYGGWVVITGATDGIGLAFAQQFAKLNFNICIISRTASKLEKVKQQLTKINDKISIRTIQADFEKSFQSGFYNNITRQLADIEVGIFVNNVGFMNHCEMLEISLQNIVKQITINTSPITQFNHYIIPKMLQRKQRSAIINLASSATIVDFQGAPIYSATKSFDDFLSRALQYQYKDNIDMISVRPFLVTSAMTRNTKHFMFINANQCASGVIKSLGYDNVTYGHFSHDIQGLLVEQLDFSFSRKLSTYVYKKFQKVYAEYDRKNLERK